MLPTLHVEGPAADLELLLVCHGLGVPVVEVPVAWEGPSEDDPHGSSLLGLALRGATLVRDLLLIRACYLMGLWTLPPAAALTYSQPNLLRR